MKRITVSLPDELAEGLKRAAGGEGQVSSYVTTALEAYQERTALDRVLAEWSAETPIPDDVRSAAMAELDDAGLVDVAPVDTELDVAGQEGSSDRRIAR